MTKTLSPVHGLRSIALALLFTVLASTPPGPPVGAQTRSAVDGQSVTLLPDGRELLPEAAARMLVAGSGIRARTLR